MMNAKELQVLYEGLLRALDIPVIETEIWSPGFYQAQGREHKIYIKNSLSVSEKIKVLVHEYAHYLHMSKYYENESRAECEIIAKGTAFFICKEIGLDITDEIKIDQFSFDPEIVKRLSQKTEQITSEVLTVLKDSFY